MKPLHIAILGCGTVGGGVARILTEMQEELSARASRPILLKEIVELNPTYASQRFNLPIELFAGGGKDLTPDEASSFIQRLIHSKDIDLIVETIGGTNDFVYNLSLDICKAKKHLVSANKSLLAERGKSIFEAAKNSNIMLGFEAAVCGAIPIVKTIKESFTGDSIISISGIMNGTSNYILSKMKSEGVSFKEALKSAQKNGYAEADPTLDINGHDAGHKLIILMKLAFGIDLAIDQLSVKGIENIEKEEFDFANEIGSTLKLICYGKQIDGEVYATVCPMMVKNDNFLSEVNGATNAIRIVNKYSGKHILVGTGAGSYETASSIVADIVFAARYADQVNYTHEKSKLKFIDARHFVFPYIITFRTGDTPGTTGFITTAIGQQKINIDTVSHNRHIKNKATFSVVTMPCTMKQVEDAIEKIKLEKPDMLLSEPKIIPILY
ncbi:MAG: homoserine dehydrogenase [Bacteroidales bacterium]|nr:homoserine dehydrogenase [Bacteroidales bacterium]